MASVHVHPDHALDVVVDRFMQSGGLLPVVSRADATRVVGAVRLRDILKPLDGNTPQSPTAV